MTLVFAISNNPFLRTALLLYSSNSSNSRGTPHYLKLKRDLHIEMSFVLHLNSGGEITLPVERAVSSSCLENLAKDFNVRKGSEDMLDVPVKAEFTSILFIYTDFLLGCERHINNINTLMLLFDVEDFYDDKLFLVYLIKQAYKLWNAFLPYLPNFYLDKEVMLRVPYTFLPDKLKTDKDFFYGKDGWIDFNKHKRVVIKGDEVFNTVLTYYNSKREQKAKLEIYYTAPNKPEELIHEEAWCGNGQLNYLWNYKDGKKDGPWEAWYANFSLSSLPSREEREEGEEREGGQPWSRWNYKDGKRDGMQEYWYASGQPKYRTNYKNGKLDGLQEGWYKDGRLRHQRTYKKGKITSEKCW